MNVYGRHVRAEVDPLDGIQPRLIAAAQATGMRVGQVAGLVLLAAKDRYAEVALAEATKAKRRAARRSAA